ncbi:hypothetical protein KCV00_g6139, partial [Aureobasidium melanogenum]
MFDKESHNHIYPKPERRRNAYMLPPSSNLARHLDPVQRLALKQSAQIFHDAICTLCSPSCHLQPEHHCLVQFADPVPI